MRLGVAALFQVDVLTFLAGIGLLLAGRAHVPQRRLPVTRLLQTLGIWVVVFGAVLWVVFLARVAPR